MYTITFLSVLFPFTTISSLSIGSLFWAMHFGSALVMSRAGFGGVPANDTFPVISPPPAWA